jgi:hypothetical protein
MAVSTTTLGALGLGVAIFVFVANLMRVKIDPREPPVVYHKIPFLGHVVGMLTQGPSYLKGVA